jgi:hypothetical protein
MIGMSCRIRWSGIDCVAAAVRTGARDVPARSALTAARLGQFSRVPTSLVNTVLMRLGVGSRLVVDSRSDTLFGVPGPFR